MGALNEPNTRRVATLFRLLSSEYDGEVLNAVAAMRRLFAAEGLTVHDIANVIESCNGQIEARKYSDADAEIIFKRGVAKGRAENGGQALSTDYIDENGVPRWLEIAKFCREHPAFSTLKPNEQNLIEEMPTRLARYGSPTRPSGGFLLSIFWKLRGSLR